MTLEGDSLQLETLVGEYSLLLFQVNEAGVLPTPVLVGNQVTSPFRNPQGEVGNIPLRSGVDDLLYSTFLGGSVDDEGKGIAVDSNGMAYVTGFTSSSDFPKTPGAFDTSFNTSNDVYVAKMNAAGSALVYATYLGGGNDDRGVGITVDSYGRATILGNTGSSNFPTTPGAFDTSYNGGDWDTFVVKLNTTGTALIYGTFLGGNSDDYGEGIAADSLGAAYVTGYTISTNFPTTPGAFNTSFDGSTKYFVVKLNSPGSVLSYATALGDGIEEGGGGIAVDSSGAAYVTGATWSSAFPVTPGAYDTSFNGVDDAFIVKLNPTGSALVYSTFLGGTTWDLGLAIAVQPGGIVVVTGETYSSNFPATPGAYDTTFNGGLSDAFVAKLNAAGSALNYATFLGGNSSEEGESIAIDPLGGVYVTGFTFSPDFPATSGAFDNSQNGNSDAFVVRLNASGSVLNYATFLGGDKNDYGFGIALDSNAKVYVAGIAWSPTFPVTPGAFDTSFNGGTADAIVVKLNTPPIILSATFRSVGVYDGYIWESDENSNVGLAANSTDTTFALGHDYSNRQYRGILHFNTSRLPNNAVITRVLLKIKKYAQTGTDPFTILGRLKVDIRTPYFGASPALVATDFQSPVSRAAVGTFGTTPVSYWYNAVIRSPGYPYINLTGTTQFRLYFTIDDTNSMGADAVLFFSGNYATASARPTLIIEYYVP
jgi:hypothetical protein